MTVKDIMLIAMFAVIAFLVVFRGCGDLPQLPPTVTTQIIHDTVEIEIVKNIHHIDTVIAISEIERVRWRIDTIAEVDTVEVIKMWQDSANTHFEVFRDTNIQATIADTIYQNDIVGRSFKYKVLRPLTVNTYKPDRFQLITSIASGYRMTYANQFQSVYIGADVGLKFKSGTYGSIGYMGGKDHIFMVRVGQVFRLKK